MNKSKVEISNQILERLNDLKTAVERGDKRGTSYSFGLVNGLASALAIICEEGE